MRDSVITRSKQGLRDLARRLPVSRSYERRIAELTELVQGWAPQWRPPGHFYSPVVDLKDPGVVAALAVDRTAAPAGIDLRLDEQWAFLDALRPHLARAEFVAGRDEATARGMRYFWQNPAYGDGDAAVLTAILCHLRPRRVIELGCGYSSACMLDVREQHLGRHTTFTFVDPYPELLDSLIRPADAADVSILEVGSQQVDLAIFHELGPGDVLFIDSTHVAKTGSDVTRIIHEILPLVAPGVVIHVHDHFPGFEYPDDWVAEGRNWNEQYLTRAFLQFNESFEILLWPSLLETIDPRRFHAGVPARHNGGGALWLHRVR